MDKTEIERLTEEYGIEFKVVGSYDCGTAWAVRIPGVAGRRFSVDCGDEVEGLAYIREWIIETLEGNKRG